MNAARRKRYAYVSVVFHLTCKQAENSILYFMNDWRFIEYFDGE